MDHPLVEWLATLPPNLKIRGGEGKWLLKKSMEPHLPHDIMYRPKMGFSVPLVRWFRGPLRERVRSSLLDGALGPTGLFERRAIEGLLDAHRSGRRDYSASLWTLLMLEAFLRVVHTDTPAPSAAPAPQPVPVAG
jgi:asparagine synthase (glutamine-hydrolysing)